MGADLSQRLVPDGLWELAAPLLPPFVPRPQGGGTAPCDERAVLTAVVYVLTSGCAWRYLPEAFGVSPATAHRRFTLWATAGLWRRLHRAVLDELGAQGELDWSSAIIDAASVRATVDQGQKPVSIVVTAGQRGDSPQFEPVLEKVRVPRIGVGRPRVRPDRVRADKAYASRKNRAYLRRRGIRCTIPACSTRRVTANSATLAAAGRRSSTQLTTVSATRSSVGSTASRGTAPSPRDTTS
uniref:transposase n=1 Tax=Streptomyces erythrochromogenes TaxID=285574 RepID=UPI0038B625FC